MNTSSSTLPLIFLYGLLAAFAALLLSALLSFPFATQPPTEILQLSFGAVVGLALIEETTKALFLWRFFLNHRGAPSKNAIVLGLGFGLGFVAVELILAGLSSWNNSLLLIIPVHIFSAIAWAFAITYLLKKKWYLTLISGSAAFVIHMVYNSIIFIHILSM